MRTLDSPDDCERLVRVHGTYAFATDDQGQAWWQAPVDDGHLFWKRVILALPRAIEPDQQVFHWNGGNSEGDRQVAAAALLDRLLELEQVGSGYHLVGHSHGGSVIWAALCLACERSKNLTGLLSWTTVGTPFLGYRRATFPGLRALVTGLVTAAVLMVMVVILQVRDSTFVARLFDHLRTVVGNNPLLGSWVVIVGIALLCLLIWAWPYLRFRKGVFERQAARNFGDKWLAVNSGQDEAINFLVTVDPLTGTLAPRWREPAPVPSHPLVSRIPGLADWRRYKPEMLPLRDKIYLGLIGLVLVLGVGALFVVSPAGIQTAWPEPLQRTVVEGMLWVFAMIGALLLIALRWGYNRYVASLLDSIVQRRLTNMAYGNDTTEFRVAFVSSCPPVSGRRDTCPTVPATIDEKLVDRANQKAAAIAPLVRRTLLYAANARTPTVAEDHPSLFGIALSGEELVHTSYFDHHEVLNIIHAHILMQSRIARTAIHALEPRVVEWIRKFKRAVAPHFGLREGEGKSV
jgi:pimeloyl-ACP methyl ester carboxylesterase